ncbi:unnamed protein product [Caenorhabditis brenneri]
MIVISGSLNNHNGCVSQETESFSQCVAACGNSETCQVVLLILISFIKKLIEVCYGAGNRICVLCDTGIVHTNSLSQKLGVKTKIYNNVCQIGLIDLTSALSTTTVSQIKTSTTTTNLPPRNVVQPKNNPDATTSCVLGFERFLLADNSYWCQVIKNHAPNGPSIGMNKEKAQELCAEVDATVSGLETEKELEYAIKLIRGLIAGNNKDISLWIDGEFRKQCFNKIPLTENCEGLKGFQFSDPSLQYFSGYHWAENEPSIDYSLGDSIRYCLKLMVPKEASDKNLGKVAVVACSSSDTESLPSTVLCGAPTIENSSITG